ncbi:MAG: hypothetical protein GXY83_34705 [Rhodopirellula sp.]|nr:hypothetical protein [Rhodopirellula sp.]
MCDQTNPAAATPPTDSGKRSGRTSFDEVARREVLAIIRNGNSRRVAARYIGCAPSTITRAAARDPEFAAELSRAESMVEIHALQAIRSAASTDRYWRAAAWLLERRSPSDFARKSDGRYTVAEVFEILARVLAALGERIPSEQREWAIQKLNTVLVEFEPGQKHERSTSEQEAGKGEG